MSAVSIKFFASIDILLRQVPATAVPLEKYDKLKNAEEVKTSSAFQSVEKVQYLK